MEMRRRKRRSECVSTTLSSNCNCNEEEEERQTSVVDLPFSIVVDILSRLPTRTLLKCRCVCKNWRYSILQDPYFTKIRLARAAIVDEIVIPVEGSLYLLELGEDSNYVHRPHWPIRFKVKYNNIRNKVLRLLGSCNGLFCLMDRFWVGRMNHVMDTIYISNPILGECVVLPKIVAKSEPCYIFGCSPTTGHYKVLKFSSLSRQRHPIPYSEVEVYTLGTDTWRNVGEAPFPTYGVESCDVTLNGAVHWMDVRVTSIYSFDFDEEQVHPIPSPPELRNINTTVDQIRLGVLRNCLCIYHNYQLYLDMWSMTDYGVAESWTKVRILKPSIPPKLGSSHYNYLFPITLWKDGEILFSYARGELLFSYNHKTESFTALKVYYPKRKVEGLFGINALTYRSSFFSLKDFASTGGLRLVDVTSQNCKFPLQIHQ